MKSLTCILMLVLLTPAYANKNQTTNNNTNANTATAQVNSNNVTNQTNSHNQTSTSSATAKQSQQQNQNTTSSATNGGNAVNQNYKQVRQTPFSYAPEAIPTAPCIKGYSAGAASPLLAGTFGAGKVDKGCDARETARQFALIGNRTAAAKILCSTDAAKRAKLTLDDCLASTPEPIVVPTEVTTEAVVPNITILPPPVVLPPVVLAPATPLLTPVAPSVNVAPAPVAPKCVRTIVKPAHKTTTSPCQK